MRGFDQVPLPFFSYFRLFDRASKKDCVRGNNYTFGQRARYKVARSKIMEIGRRASQTSIVDERQTTSAIICHFARLYLKTRNNVLRTST